jgi:large subunit ribosomal protein L28
MRIEGVIMSRVCTITGKRGLSGNRVSHANNKTRRRFDVNLQETSLMSEALGHVVRLRITTHGIRTVESHGGLDAFLLQARAVELQPEAARIKKAIKKRIAAKAAVS